MRQPFSLVVVRLGLLVLANTQRIQIGATLHHLVGVHGQQDFEGTLIALMRELGIGHVEAHLTALGRVATRVGELESGGGIDKPSDEPGAGYPVDVDIPPRHPRLAAQLLQ